MSQLDSKALYLYLNSVWTNVTTDVIFDSVQVSGGMRSNKPLDRLAYPGSMTFSLKNSTKKYSPDHASALSGWKKGVPVKLVLTFGGREYVKFYGTVDKIDIDPGIYKNRRAYVHAVTWLDHAIKYPLDNPAVQEDKRADEAITTIIDSMPIAPLATDLGTGVNTFPTVFNNATIKTRAYSEFNKLALSEMGYIYEKADGTFVFEPNDARPVNTPVKSVIDILENPGFLLNETGGYHLKEDGGKIILEDFDVAEASIDNTMVDMDVSYGDNLINRVTTSAHPAKINTFTSLVYELEKPQFVESGKTLVFNVEFTEPNSKRLVAVLAPETEGYSQTLLHFDEEDITSPIKDDAGHSWGVQGDVGFNSEFKKFGPYSIYLDGSASYVDAISSDDYNFYGGDFTVEWWEYRFNNDNNAASTSRDSDASYPPFVLGVSDTANLLIYMSSNGTSFNIANGKSMGAITLNTWNHFAISRNGSNFYAFKNGVLTDSWTSASALPASTAIMTIGKNGGTYLTACIDEFRMTKGLARYTSNFNVPTEAFVLSGQFFTAWTLSNRGGTELTKDFTITTEYGAAGGQITVFNGNETLDGYLTTLKVYAYIIESVSPITSIQEDSVSYNEFGIITEDIDQIYQQDLNFGITEAGKILEREKQPRTVLNKVTMSANRSDAMMLIFLQTDVGDLVEVIEEQTGIAFSYFVQGVDFSIVSGGNIFFTWTTKEFLPLLSPVAVEFQGYQTYQRVDFGYVPKVFDNNVKHRIFSTWIYIDTAPASGGGIFFFNKNYTIFLDVLRKINFIGRAGVWWATTTVIGYNSWHHVLVAYDQTSLANDPVMYINNTLQSLSEPIAPYEPEPVFISSSLDIGIAKNTPTNWSYTLDGKLSDMRIYDFSQTGVSIASLASSLYSAGRNGTGNITGLLFNAFSVTTKNLTYYTDLELSETDKLIDATFQVTGTPKNTPPPYSSPSAVPGPYSRNI